MPKTSFLQFESYDVEEMVFRRPLDMQNVQEFELCPRFKHEVTEQEGNRYDVTVSMEIASSEERPAPFDLRVSLVGHFVITHEEGIAEEVRANAIQKNTLTILFPFLRAAVASLTSAANIPSLILPVMNFAEMV